MINGWRAFLAIFAVWGAFAVVGGWTSVRADEPASDVAAEATRSEFWLANRLETIGKLEAAGDWEKALRLAESTYESEPLDDAARIALRKKFETERRKVEPNRDPEKAGVWRVRAFVVRTLDFDWEDENGSRRSFKATYSDADVERIRRGMKGFAERVWTYSDGWLRIDWTLEVVERTATKLEGDARGGFWPGPVELMKILPEIPVNSVETIMTFVNTGGENPDGERNDSIPLMLFGGAIGEWSPVTRGATYIAFNWEPNAASNEPDGEPPLHEWLHSLQWTLDERQGWPLGLSGNPDGGRFVGEEREPDSADPCYRRDPATEPSWMRLYEHILRTHTTRKMLKNAPNRNFRYSANN